MNLDSARAVERWFKKHDFGHLQLPDGWFGRPWDNQHQLTWIAARPERLLIEIDDQLLLVLDGDVTTEAGTEKPDSAGWAVAYLNLDGFAQCVFDRRDYGGEAWHARVFGSGPIRFLRHTGAE